MSFLVRSWFLLFFFSISGSSLAELELDPETIEGCSTEVSLPPATSQADASANKILPPTQGVYPGLYNIGSTLSEYKAYKTKAGKAPVIVHTFHDFISSEELFSNNSKLRAFDQPLEGDDAPTPLALATELSKDGAALAISWAIECCNLESMSLWYGLSKANTVVPRILNGDFDSDLRTAARQIKALGHPVMLGLFGEFAPQAWFLFGKDGRTAINYSENICNGYGNPAWPDGPERVRDTYRHVIDIFRQEGVKNVTWFMYTSTGYMNVDDEDYTAWLHPKYFYPGDAYIDWVGQSAYFIDPENRPDVNEGVQDITKAIMNGYNAWGSVTQRPFIIPEFGAASDGSQSRAQIIQKVVTEFLPGLPRVKAFTFANAELFKQYFEIPILGEQYPDEMQMWKSSVINNPAFQHSLIIK